MWTCPKPTILKLLVDLGTACAEFHNERVRNLHAQRIQCDEIWQFCYSKAKNVPVDKKGQFGYGDVWTWTAIDADTKLVPSWFVGSRDVNSAHWFMRDLESRLLSRVQLTSDGHHAYLTAVDDAFDGQIDYAQLVKIYGHENREGAVRYSPAQFVAARREVIRGNPDLKPRNDLLNIACGGH